jgi:hypothetical protein
VAELVRRFVEGGVPAILVAACAAPQRHVAYAAAAVGGFPGRAADARQSGDFLRHTASKRMPIRTKLELVGDSCADIR